MLFTSNQALRFAEWVGPDGGVRCRWPGSAAAGQPSEDSVPLEGAADGAHPGAPGEGLIAFSAPVKIPARRDTPAGLVRLTFAFEEPGPPPGGPGLLRGCAVAVVVTLLVYFALYRRLKRHLRPMDAIQRNLHSYASGLEKEFVALSLSDSLGRVAQAWNDLIEQVAELRNRQSEADWHGLVCPGRGPGLAIAEVGRSGRPGRRRRARGAG